MEITDRRKAKKVNEMDISEEESGLIFSGHIDGHGKGIFLKIFEAVVDLEDPENVWHCTEDGGPFLVEDFEELEAELIVK